MLSLNSRVDSSSSLFVVRAACVNVFSKFVHHKTRANSIRFYLTGFQNVRLLVYVSTDPGHDDAMAIILAGHNSRIKLLGLSIVGGNVPVEKCTKNALHVSSA